MPGPSRPLCVSQRGVIVGDPEGLPLLPLRGGAVVRGAGFTVSWDHPASATSPVTSSKAVSKPAPHVLISIVRIIRAAVSTSRGGCEDQAR